MPVRFFASSIFATAILVATACGPTAPPSDPDDGGVGDSAAPDVGRDAGEDAPVAEDAGLDAPRELDAGADAGVLPATTGLIRGGPDTPDQFVSVAVDHAGHITVGGMVSAEFDLGCGPDIAPSERGTAAVVVYDGAGECIRTRLIGTDASFSKVLSVEHLADGSLIVVGSAEGPIDLGAGVLPALGLQDLFVARYDPSGALAWGRRIGGLSAPVGLSSVVVDEGSIVLAGVFSGTVDFGDGPLTAGAPSSTFVLVIEPTGDTRWSAAYGSGRAGGTAVALDDAGGLFVAGGFGGTIDLGGDELTSSGPAPDVFVASLSVNDGAHRWSRRFGDGGTQIATTLAVTATGQLIVAGTFDGTVDFGGGTLPSTAPFDAFVATLLSADGAHERSLALVGAADQLPVVVLSLADGFLLGGSLSGATDFGGGATPTSGVGGFLARFDDGNGLLGARYFGVPGRTGVADVAVVGDGFVVVGTTETPIDFGAGPVSGPGGQDGYIAFVPRLP